MGFEITTALKKMLALTADKKVIQGSTNSGKTYGIIPIAYDRCLETPLFKATIVAETLTAVKEGALDIFIKFMVEEGRWDDSKWNASNLIYTLDNKSRLQFKSFDTIGKAKASGKRDFLFMNEANHIDFEIADALMIRSNEVWMDFNADMEFWAHTEVLTSDNAEFLKLTYEDNEAIPPVILHELMQKKAKAEREERNGNKGYWWNWWQVYGLGEIGQLQEGIFPVWEVLKEKPERFKSFVYGIDFGFIHPTALIRIWYFEDELFVEEVIYQKGLTSGGIIEKMRTLKIEDHIEIIADYARPEIIGDLRNAGFYILNADKSVKKGLNCIKEKTVFVHYDSINIIRENKKYKYKKINGQVTEEVLKVNDDAMDAIRYGGLWTNSYSSDEFSETISLDI